MQTSIELQPVAKMNKIKDLFQTTPAYEPIQDQQHEEDDDGSVSDETPQDAEGPPFSWVEYSIFLLLGVAMLWAWQVVQPLFWSDADCLKEHVSCSCSLLPEPLPIERMDPEPLPGCRDICVDSHELGINAVIDEATKRRKLPEENFNVADHQHCCLCYPVRVDLD